MTQKLLEHIWSDNFEVRDASEISLVAQILKPILAAPILCCTSEMFPTSRTAIATYAGTEVMPGATLADVLFEEHGIETSDDTIIYIEPVELGSGPAPSSEEMGWIIGQVLLNLVRPDAEISADATPTMPTGQQLYVPRIATDALVQ